MKYLSVLGLLFIGSFNIMGQRIKRLDQGNMPRNRSLLEFAVSVIQFIEQGETDLVLESCSPEFTPDSSVFSHNVQEIVSKCSFETDILPYRFYKDDTESPWYTRTYYKLNGTQVEYLYQIYVQSAEIDGLFKVTNIQFRKADEIANLEQIREYINEMMNPDEIPDEIPETEILIPPPPPAVGH